MQESGGTTTTQMPDGSTIIRYPDQTTVTTLPDGTTTTLDPDGTTTIIYPDGTGTRMSPSGPTLTFEPDSFAVNSPCGTDWVEVSIDKSDTHTSSSFDVRIAELGQGVVYDSFVDVEIDQQATIRIAPLPLDSVFTVTIERDGVFVARRFFGTNSQGCNVPPWLIKYDAQHLIMNSAMSQEAEEIADDLALNDREFLYLDQDGGGLFVSVDANGGELEFTGIGTWAILKDVYLQDPSIAIFDPNYNSEIRYEESPLTPGIWRIFWPDGNVAWATPEVVAITKYAFGERLNAGFSAAVVPDYVANNYYGSWTPSVPFSLMGETHELLDLVGMFPLVGEPADLFNALFYVVEQDWTNAGISAGALVPVGGQALTGARIADRMRGTLKGTFRATDDTIVHVIQRADGTFIEAIETSEGAITIVARLGDDFVQEIDELARLNTESLAQLVVRQDDTLTPVVSLAAVRQADGTFATTGEITENLLDKNGRLLSENPIDGSGLHAQRVREIEPNIVPSGDRLTINDVGEYMDGLNDVYIDVFEEGLHPDVDDLIRTYIGDGQDIFVFEAGHAGGLFPGTHAEIVAINNALNTNPELLLADLAVSSMWTAAAPTARTVGDQALTCPNCRGILSESGVRVATDNLD